MFPPLGSLSSVLKLGGLKLDVLMLDELKVGE